MLICALYETEYQPPPPPFPYLSHRSIVFFDTSEIFSGRESILANFKKYFNGEFDNSPLEEYLIMLLLLLIIVILSLIYLY